MTQKNKTAVLVCAAAALLTAGGSAKADIFDKSWLAKENFQIRGRVIDIQADGDGVIAENTALETNISSEIVPELDITYFFTDHIAAELVLATAQHDITAGASNVGDAWILPPTVVLQYHFTPDKKISPYVGAGLNYSFFYEEDAATGFTDLDVDGGLGFALQAGVDYWINDNWGWNFDVKYLSLDINANVNNGALNALDVDLDPIIIGTGVSYRF